MKKYTREYKEEAVKLWLENGRNSQETGRRLGLNPQMFAKWYRVLNGEATGPAQRPITQAPGLSPSPAELAVEVARLKRENARLQTDYEILKKTVAIFSAGTHK